MFSPYTKILNYGNLVNRQASLNRNLLQWIRVLPQRFGGLTIWNALNYNNGTISAPAGGNSNVWSRISPPGGFGSLYFNGGVGGTNSIDFNLETITGDLTTACWIKTPSPANLQVLIGCHPDPGSPYPGWSIFLSVITSSKINFWSQGYGAWVSGNTAIGTNWTHIAVSLIGTSLTFYINGIPDGTVTTAAPTSYTGSKRLGATASGGLYPYIGYMDDIRIYNRGLSNTEIAQLYLASITGYQKELNRWQHLLFGNIDTPNMYTGPITQPLFSSWIRGRKLA